MVESSVTSKARAWKGELSPRDWSSVMDFSACALSRAVMMVVVSEESRAIC